MLQAKAFRKRGEAAFYRGRYDESIRAFTVAIDLVSKLLKEGIEATASTGSSTHRQELSRLLYRR